MDALSPVRNAFTVDVEDYFHVSAYNRVIDPKNWDQLPSRVEGNTQAMMSLLDEANVKGTFFVLGWVAKRFPGLVRQIAAHGHEVACHGWSHQLIYNQGRDAFTQETRRSKALLEDITGRAVTGYRAASFSITGRSLWALDVLAELDFAYDSSVFPVKHDRYGIPGAPRRPFRYVSENGQNISEFPMTTVDLPGWRMPVSGGGYFRIYPYWVSAAAFRHLNGKRGEAFMFYAHPWEIDPEQPLMEAGAISNFRHRTNLGKCRDRLERLLREFSFTTASKVLEGLALPSMRPQDRGLMLCGEPIVGARG